jgi:hypothetical protein
MKELKSLAYALAIGLQITACSRAHPETCIVRTPSFEGSGPGFELIDILRRNVWATRDWSPNEFSEFSTPILWRKNDPRLPLHNGGRFLRSPACAEDGQFSYLHAFDRSFLHVVKLRAFPGSADMEGHISKVELEKYHVLNFSAGGKMSVLKSPTGDQFIGVSRSLKRRSSPPTIPSGWTLTQRTLLKNVEIELIGVITVLRLDNQDSYQGPVVINI